MSGEAQKTHCRSHQSRVRWETDTTTFNTVHGVPREVTQTDAKEAKVGADRIQ